MTFKILSYLFAGAGLLLALHLIRSDKRYWKGACWIICFSLLIVAGGNIQIGQVNPSISDAFKVTHQITAITNQLADLKVQVSQTVSMKQEVLQTVNVITKVEKDIANMKETIEQLYARIQTDSFSPSDTDKRCAFSKSDGGQIVALRLTACPVKGSIQGIWANKVLYPSSIKWADNVMVSVFSGNTPPTNDIFSITYMRDVENKHLFEKMEVKDNTLYLDGRKWSPDSLP